MENLKQLIKNRVTPVENRQYTSDNSAQYFKIPRFTPNGERIYKLSVNDIAAYLGINRQNINYYLVANQDMFFKVEKLGEHDAKILGIKSDPKRRIWIVYATKCQLEALRP